MSNRQVIILRGVPGSGKTSLIDAYILETWKEQRVGHAYTVSADHYFTDNTGQYRFDPKEIGKAHQRCLRLFINVCISSTPIDGDTVFVDNTNISEAEIAPYYAIAEAYDWNPEIWTLKVDPKIAAARNIHGVPEDVVHKMWVRLNNPLPPWWRHKEIQK